MIHTHIKYISKLIRKADRENLRENAWGLGRDGVVEPVRIVSNTSFWRTSSGIPIGWSVATVYFNTYVNHLPASPGQSLTNMSSTCR